MIPGISPGWERGLGFHSIERPPQSGQHWADSPAWKFPGHTDPQPLSLTQQPMVCKQAGVEARTVICGSENTIHWDQPLPYSPPLRAQVGVPDAQGGQTNWNAGVWSREGLIAGPGKEKDSWLRAQNTASSAFGKELLKSQVMEELAVYVISWCTSFWLADGEVSRGLILDSRRPGAACILSSHT